jgi:hypothetical protein
LAAALGKLTSGLPTSSTCQEEIRFERKSTIRYLHVAGDHATNSNHIPDGTWIALLPLINPTTCETAYFGGIEIIM